jgi:MFS family permease
LIGVGLGFSFVPVSIAALAGATGREAGLASGLINTSQQIGGAIGIAIATTIFRTKAKDLGFTPAGFVSGYQDAFWALIALALIGAVAAFILLRGVRREDVVEQEPAEVAV